MIRFNNISINTFKGIKQLKLNNLGDVNLIVGENNVGKTSILEAIMLMQFPGDIMSIVQNSRTRTNNYNPFKRTTSFDTFMQMFAFNEDEEKTINMEFDTGTSKEEIIIKGRLETKIKKLEPSRYSNKNSNLNNEDIEQEVLCFTGKLNYNVYSDNLKSQQSVSEDIDLDNLQEFRIRNKSKYKNINYVSSIDHVVKLDISRAILKGQKGEIIELLKLVDPDIYDYDLVRNDDKFGQISEVIHHKKLGVVPLHTFGDGLKKILSLASNIVSSKDGILLIDEIETSVHHSLLSDIVLWMTKACKKFNVQIFATTHSLEAVSVFAENAVNYPAILNCYRIEKNREIFTSKRFSENELNDIVNGSGLDVR